MQLNVSYENMGDTTFKALRRILPITRSKVLQDNKDIWATNCRGLTCALVQIDWDKMQNYNLGGDITEYTKD